MSEPLPPISDHFLQADSEVPVEFVREHLRHVFSLIYQLVADIDVAQDLTQDTFIRALQRKPGARRLERIGQRLPALAATAALEYLRRTEARQNFPNPQGRRRSVRELTPTSEPLQEPSPALTTSERVALLLHDTEHMPLSTVARRLDCPKASARIHLARARVKISQFLLAKRGS